MTPGERKAYLELFKAFAREKQPVEAGKTGVLGMTPQDVSDLKAADKIREKFVPEDREQSAMEWETGLMR